MDYGKVLAMAWKITWKHKVLWLFGLLAAVTQVFNVGNNLFRIVTQSNILPPKALYDLAELLDVRSADFWIGLGSITCGMMFFLLFLTSLGQIGMIKGAALADSGKDTPLSLGEVTGNLKPYFWRVFGLSLLVGFGFLFLFLLLYAILFAVILGGVFAVRDSSPMATLPILLLAITCLIPLMCIFILVSWIIGAAVMLTTIAIINDDLGILAAFRRSFQLLEKQFWKILLITLLISVIGGIAGVILALPISATSFVPLLALSNREIGGTAVWITVICLAAYTPVLVLVTAILTVFTQAVWTLAYRRLASPVEVPAPSGE